MSKFNFLRYPGSKEKLLPSIMKYLVPLLEQSNSFADVFVGGGAVLLEVAQRYPHTSLFCNDKDTMMYSLWKILSEKEDAKFEELIHLISSIVPTVEAFNELRNVDATNDVGLAYRAVFFNRCCFSGMLHAGPIGGKGQVSKYKINCRYNATKIVEKMKACRTLLRGRLFVTNMDVADYLPSLSNETCLYLDPPYVKAGKQLYPVFMETNEHAAMAKALQLKKHWVLSYDDDSFIKFLYQKNEIIDLATNYCINGKKTSWKPTNELLILSEGI